MFLTYCGTFLATFNVSFLCHFYRNGGGGRQNNGLTKIGLGMNSGLNSGLKNGLTNGLLKNGPGRKNGPGDGAEKAQAKITNKHKTTNFILLIIFLIYFFLKSNVISTKFSDDLLYTRYCSLIIEFCKFFQFVFH